MENILVLTNNIGGLHSFRKEVMKAIVDIGFQVYISTPDDDQRTLYFESIGCSIVKTEFNRRGTNPLADFNLMLAYRRLIKELSPKVVLTYTIKPNIYGGIACRLTHTPQLANVTGLGDALENPGALQKLSVALYRLGLSKAKRVFFQNKSNRERGIQLGIADESSVLLPGSGVNLSHHTFQPYAEDGVVRFLYIGRMLRDKGIVEYLNTAKFIKEKYPATEFQILGDCEGDYKKQLDEMVGAGVINYLGTTTDVRPFIGAVHCTIMPSYHEGMSNVNLESAANGRPVITTDVPGCRETVDDELSGYLVQPHSTESLIDAVERFLSLSYTEKANMGKAGRMKVEKEFDRQMVVDAYLKEIGKL